MNWDYIEATIWELAVLGLITYAAHFGVAALTGINMLNRAVTDFQTLPVPYWTWPTWVLAALAIAVVAFEIVYRVMVYVRNVRGS